MKMRTTVSSHIRKKTLRYLDYDLGVIFNSLRDIVRVYEDKLDVKTDNEFHYEVWTDRGYRIKSSPPKSKKGVEFASVIAFEKYIGFYFLPLCVSEALRDNIKPELRKFSAGRFTFHFNTLDSVMTSQIEEMIRDGWAFYQKEGLVV